MARREKDFLLADAIRDELALEGVELLDLINEWRSLDGTYKGQQSSDFRSNARSSTRSR